eukprot:4478966-Amphidinium_carterae.1
MPCLVQSVATVMALERQLHWHHLTKGLTDYTNHYNRVNFRSTLELLQLQAPQQGMLPCQH